MATKFFKNLTQNGAGIKESRAQLIFEDTEAAQQELVLKLQGEERALKRKLEALNDLYPKTELSLEAVKDGFDPKRWVSDVQSIKVQLLTKRVELQSALETQKEQFTDEEETISK